LCDSTGVLRRGSSLWIPLNSTEASASVQVRAVRRLGGHYRGLSCSKGGYAMSLLSIIYDPSGVSADRGGRLELELRQNA
jgi:hypothetical protein